MWVTYLISPYGTISIYAADECNVDYDSYFIRPSECVTYFPTTIMCPW